MDESPDTPPAASEISAGPPPGGRPTNESTDRTAFRALILGAVILGWSPILVRLSELGPTATAFQRVFLALPLLWVWMSAEKSGFFSRRTGGSLGRVSKIAKRPPSSKIPAGDPPAAAQQINKKDYAVLTLAGFFFAGDLAFWHWSLQFTSVANATLLATMAPIHVTLGAFLFFGQRFRSRFLAGVAVAVTGSAILMGGSFTIGLQNLFGDFLGFVTGMFFGAYVLTIGRLRAKFSTATIMAWSTLAAAVFLLPVTVASGESFFAQTAYGWFILLALALVAHTVGQGFIAYALAHLPAAFSSVGLLMEAVAAAALAWIILGEPLGPPQYLGAAIIMAGIFIARRGSRKERGRSG